MLTLAWEKCTLLLWACCQDWTPKTVGEMGRRRVLWHLWRLRLTSVPAACEIALGEGYCDNCQDKISHSSLHSGGSTGPVPSLGPPAPQCPWCPPSCVLQVMKFEATSRGHPDPLGQGDHQDPKEIVAWWLGLCLHHTKGYGLPSGCMENPLVLRDPMGDHWARAAHMAAPWAACHLIVPQWAVMALMRPPWAMIDLLMGCWQRRNHAGDQVQADPTATPSLVPWITMSWHSVCQRVYRVSGMPACPDPPCPSTQP